jgi:malate dehydrogenase
LGSNGIEKIIDIKLTEADKAHLMSSADGVKKTNGLLKI